MTVLRYRTEIVVSPDRYVCLQLPDHFPEGLARVTVSYDDPSPSDPAEAPDSAEPDDPDIEWWEEFDGEPRRTV